MYLIHVKEVLNWGRPHFHQKRKFTITYNYLSGYQVLHKLHNIFLSEVRDFRRHKCQTYTGYPSARPWLLLSQLYTGLMRVWDYHFL